MESFFPHDSVAPGVVKESELESCGSKIEWGAQG